MELLKNKKAVAVFVAAALLALAGMGAWVHEGLASTSDMGLTSAVPWGSSMALFIVFIGLATGSLLVAAASVLFGWKSLERVCGASAAAGLAASIGGVFYIMSDLGNFPNVWHMMTGFNPASLLSWDMIALPLFMVSAVMFLLCLRLGRGLRGAAVFAVVASLFLQFIDAWIFAFTTAREAWNSSLMLPWFIVSAVLSGLALTLLVAAPFGVSFAGDKKVLNGLVALLAIDLFFAVTEVALGLYHGTGTDFAVSTSLLGGTLAPWFWIELACGIGALCVALRAKTSPSKALPVVSSALVLAAICAKRLYFIGAGFVVPLMAEPTAEGIMAHAALASSAAGMTPTAWLLALGGIGLLVALFLVARAVTPLGNVTKA